MRATTRACGATKAGRTRARAWTGRARAMAPRARATESEHAMANVMANEKDQEMATTTSSRLRGAAAACACACAVMTDVARARAGVYDAVGVPDDEATPLQNVFGVLFTGFSLWYFARAVTRRSGKAREFRVANQLPEEERRKIDEARAEKTRALTAGESFAGGATGLGISVVLYAFATKISASFDGRALPESETVRQISITVRTIVEGMAYLATFVYAANGAGLIALAGQKAMDYANGKDLVDGVSSEENAEGDDGVDGP